MVNLKMNFSMENKVSMKLSLVKDVFKWSAEMDLIKSVVVTHVRSGFMGSMGLST